MLINFNDCLSSLFKLNDKYPFGNKVNFKKLLKLYSSIFPDIDKLLSINLSIVIFLELKLKNGLLKL